MSAAATKPEPKGFFHIIASRANTYFQMGYSLVSIPFQILGLSSAIYLAVNRFLPWLHYSDFIVAVFVIGLPTAMFLGWAVYHFTHIYGQSQVVQVKSSPYTYWKIAGPKEEMAWRINYAWAKQMGLTDVVKQIEDMFARNNLKIGDGSK